MAGLPQRGPGERVASTQDGPQVLRLHRRRQAQAGRGRAQPPAPGLAPLPLSPHGPQVVALLARGQLGNSEHAPVSVAVRAISMGFVYLHCSQSE